MVPTRVLMLALLAACLPAQDQRAGQLREQIDLLIEQLLTGTRAERWQASDELARLSTPAAMPLVERYLTAPLEDALEPLVPATLVAMGPGTERAAARLLDEIDEQDGGTYWRALKLAAEVGPWHASLRPRLRALETPNERALARMATQAGYRDPAELTEDLQHEWQVLHARLAIDLDASADELIDVCRHGSLADVEFAALLLARHDRPLAAVPVLAQTLDKVLDPTTNLKYSWRGHEMMRAVVEALVTIAPRDPRTIRAHLARIHWHYPKAVRLRAARAIAAMGAEAGAAVPGLISCRNSWDDDDVMREVVVALGTIGAAADPAITMLEELIHDVKFDDDLIAAARLALTRIRGH